MIRSVTDGERSEATSYMELKIKLTDGETLNVRVDLTAEEWERQFQKALKRRKLLTVRRSDGEILAINPTRVEFMRYGIAAERPKTAPAGEESPSPSAATETQEDEAELVPVPVGSA
jgi:hypothetical protein